MFGLVCLVPLDVSQPGQMLPEPLKPFTEAAACKLQVSLELLCWNIPSVICTHAHCSNGCNIFFYIPPSAPAILKHELIECHSAEELILTLNG